MEPHLRRGVGGRIRRARPREPAQLGRPHRNRRRAARFGRRLPRLGDTPDRRVIDLSGDGMANIGSAPDQVRDGLVAKGITINGLAILKTEPWLDQYYDMNVVGGEHSFLLKVEDFQSFATAIQQKLLGEISALPSHIAAEGPSPASAGEGLWLRCSGS